MISGYIISFSFYEQFVAVVTIGVVPFGKGNVAHIDITYSLIHGQFAETDQD